MVACLKLLGDDLDGIFHLAEQCLKRGVRFIQIVFNMEHVAEQLHTILKLKRRDGAMDKHRDMLPLVIRPQLIQEFYAAMCDQLHLDKDDIRQVFVYLKDGVLRTDGTADLMAVMLKRLAI